MGNELSQPVIIKRSKVLSVSEADPSSKKGCQDDGGVYIGEPDQTFIDNDSENTSPKTLYFSLNQLNENKMSGEPVIQRVKLCDLAKMYTGRKTESTSPVKPVYCDIINGDDISRVDMCNNHVEKVQKQDTMDETCEKPSLLCSEKDKEKNSEEFRSTQAEDIVKRLSGGENGITKEMFDGYVKDSQPIRPPRPSKLAKMRLNVSNFELKGKKYSKPRKGDSEKESVSQTKLVNVETIEKHNVSEFTPQGEKVLNTNELCDSENQSDASIGIHVFEKLHAEKLSQNSHDEMGVSHVERLSKNLYDETEKSHNLHAEIEKESSNVVKETDNLHTEKETINMCMKTTLGSSLIGPKKEASNVVIETETPHIETKTEVGNSHVSVENSDVEKDRRNSFLEAENSTIIHAESLPPLDSAVRDNSVPVCEVKPLRVIASEVVDSSKISLDGATEMCEDHAKHGSIKEDVFNDISESENCAATSDITIPTKPDVTVSEKVVEDKKEKKNKVTYNTFSRKVAAIWEEYSHGDTIAKETESVNTSKKEPKVKKSNSFWKYLTYHETPKKSKERQRRKNNENGTLNSSDFRKVFNEGKGEIQEAKSSKELKPNVNECGMDLRDEESFVMENEVNVDTSDNKSNSTSKIAETSIEVSCTGNGHLPETFPVGSDILRESSTDKTVKDIESSDTIVQCKINGTESGRFEDRKNLDSVVNVLPQDSESALGSEVLGASEIQGNMEPKNAKEKKERKTTKRNNSISAKISDFLFQDFRRRSSNKVDKRPDKIRPERRRKHSSTGSKHSSSSIEENTIQEEVSESDRTSKTEKVSGISKLLSLSNMNLSTTKEKKAKRRKSSSTMDITGVGVNDVRPSDEPRQRPKSIFDEEIDVTIDEQKDDVVSLSSLSSENEDEGKHKVQVHVPNEKAGSFSNVVKWEHKEPSVGKEEVEVSLQCTEFPILKSSPESENKLVGESDLKEDSYVRLRVISGDSQEDISTSSGSEDVLKKTEPITDLDDDESLPPESSVKGACSDKHDSELASIENDETEQLQTVNQKVFVSSCTLSLSSPLYNLISDGEEAKQRTTEQERTEDTQENDESGVHETVKVLIAEHEHHVTSCDTTSYDYEVVSPPSTEMSNNCDRNFERFGLMLAERDEQISSDTKGNISPSSDTDIVRTLSLQELHVQLHVYDEIENKRPIIYRRFSDRDERDVIRTAPDGTDGKHGKKKKRSRSFSDLFKKSNRKKAQWRAKRKIRDDSARKIADEVSPSAASPTSSIVHM